MAKDRREQDRQEAESKRQAAEQMVQARESLGYGGVSGSNTRYVSYLSGNLG